MAGETRVEMISVNDVLAGRLPERACGVHWADTNWTDCRPHLTDPSWTPDRRDDAPVGVVLYGPLVCNACEAVPPDPWPPRREDGRRVT